MGTPSTDVPQDFVPDPQVAAMKTEFEEWGTKTTIGVLAGMLYGGSREAFQSSKEEEALLPSPKMRDQDWRQRRRALRELMELRVLRIARGTVLGGAKLGAFTALFCGVQHGLAVTYNGHSTYNVVAAGGATAAAFGFTLPGSLLLRMRSAVIGSLLGAALCFPLGLLHSALQKEVASIEKEALQAPPAGEIMGNGIDKKSGGIDAVIQRLEKRLSDR